jgi:hypothetical protein
MTLKIESAAARFRILDSFDGFGVRVAARTNWFVALFMLGWVGGWAVGETTAIASVVSPAQWDRNPGAQIFTFFWLLLWTTAGVGAIYTLVWLLFGSEVIRIEGGKLTYRVQAMGAHWTRAFAIEQIARMRVFDVQAYNASRRSNSIPVPSLFADGAGSIVFDYGAGIRSIGVSLDATEARQLIGQMRPWLPDGAVAGSNRDAT